MPATPSTKRKREHSMIGSLRLLGGLCLIMFVLLPLWLYAQAPNWWDEQGVINSSAQPNDYAALNQGQLKNLARAAAAEFDVQLPGGAGADIHQLIAEWNIHTAAANDYAAVNLGQLKQVAKHFYNPLIAIGYTNAYPWANAAHPANDYALANIGQAKNLFGFDLLKVDPSDPNGLPDWWEHYYFPGQTNINPSADPDGDGLTNLQEFQFGTDPTNFFNPSGRAGVILTSPASGATYPASANVYASAACYGSSSISKVEFYADATKIGESNAPPYGVTWSQPATGTHSLMAVATNSGGATLTSTASTIVVAACPPQVNLVSTQPTYTQASGQLIAQVLGMTPSTLASLTLNGQAIPLQTGRFPINVTLSNGDNPFTLVATDNQGRIGQATLSVLCAMTGPTLTISQPTASASIHYAWINVKGTVNAPSPIASLTVNGVKAFVTGNDYTAPAVPIVAGTNTLTAKATDVAGNVSTASVNVTGTTTAPGGLMTSPVALQANPPSGVGPLPVTLTSQINVTEAIQEIDYDFDGDGATDYTTNATTPLVHIYSSAGEFYPVVTVVTSAGSFSSHGGFNAGVGNSRPTVDVYQQPQVQNFLSVTNPVDVVAAADGSAIYVLSGSMATVTKFSPTGQVMGALANVGVNPTGLDIDKTGNVYVALSGNNRVIRLKPSGATFVLDTTFNATGSIGKADGSASSDGGAFSSPSDVAVSADGTAIYVADTNNNRVEKFTTDGKFLQVVDATTNGLGALNQPKGLCAGPGDTVYVADTGNNRLVRIDRDVVTGVQGTPGTQNGQFAAPRNVASNGDGVYVADTGNNRIQNFASEASDNGTDPATFSFQWSSGSQGGLSAPGSVTCGFDLAGTTLYVADTGNNRVMLLKVARSDTPMAVWQQMQTRMAGLDIEGAVGCFTESQQDSHRSYFRALGAQRSAAVVAGTGPISPIFIDKDEAEYNIDQTIAGRIISFPVWFVRENGRWKIEEF